MSTLESTSLVIKGVRAELRLADGVVSIHKQGDTVTAPTSVEFPVTRIRGTSLESPRRGGRGWFHLSVIGGTPAPVGEMGAMSDPYALPITARAAGGCKRLARWVDRHLHEYGLPSEATPNDGRFGSGVVLTQPSSSPPAPGAAPDAVEASGASAPAGAAGSDRKRPASKKSTAKKSTARKTAKKAAGKKRVAKKSTARKSTSPKAGGQAPTPKRGSEPVVDGVLAAQELVDQLRQLGELHAAGVLTADEFAAAKARILA